MREFNYLDYIKNNPLLQEDLPKNKWVNLNPDEIDQYKEEIIELIKNAYKEIGGHPNYNSPNDVSSSEDYEVINIDADPEPDAVSVGKTRPFGKKLVATGHDGSKEAKSAVINHKAQQLKSKGFYIEVSGRIKDILIAKGVPIISDEATIRKVLDGKRINMNPDGSYERNIGGKIYTKILLGNPL